MVLLHSYCDVPENEVSETASALAHLMVGVDALLHQPAQQTLLRWAKLPNLEAFISGEATDALFGCVAALEDEISFVQTQSMPQVGSLVVFWKHSVSAPGLFQHVLWVLIFIVWMV